MKSYRKELTLQLPERMAFVNITDDVRARVRESGIVDGLVLVNPMHITASVFINDDESGLHHDYKNSSKRSFPMHRTGSIATMIPAKTMRTLISNVSSWAGKLSLPSPKVNLISAPGRKFFTANLTAGEASACW